MENHTSKGTSRELDILGVDAAEFQEGVDKLMKAHPELDGMAIGTHGKEPTRSAWQNLRRVLGASAGAILKRIGGERA